MYTHAYHILVHISSKDTRGVPARPSAPRGNPSCPCGVTGVRGRGWGGGRWHTSSSPGDRAGPGGVRSSSPGDRLCPRGFPHTPGAYGLWGVLEGGALHSGLACRKIKLEFLENPSSTWLGYSRIPNLIQAHFWDFLEIACWYWPDLAIFAADKLGIGRINLNFRQERGFQENSSLSDSLKIQAQC